MDSELQRLRQENKQLKQIINDAYHACWLLAQQSGAILSSSGIPRGQWSYAKGVYTVASKLIGIFEEATQ